VQFVGNGEGGEDRGFLSVHRGGGVRDGAHFFIHIGGQFLYVGGIEIADDGIGLPVDLDSGWHVRLAAGPGGKGSTGRRAASSGSWVVSLLGSKEPTL